MRTIKGFPGYFVSKQGHVFTKKNGKVKRLHDAPKPSGYRSVVLYKDGEPHHKYLHRLVADAYGKGGETIEHIGDKGDNSIDNLQGMSQKRNTFRAYAELKNAGPVGELNGKSKITASKAKKIKSSKMSGVDLARKYKVSEAEISRIRSKNADRWTGGRNCPHKAKGKKVKKLKEDICSESQEILQDLVVEHCGMCDGLPQSAKNCYRCHAKVVNRKDDALVHGAVTWEVTYECGTTRNSILTQSTECRKRAANRWPSISAKQHKPVEIAAMMDQNI